MIRLVYHRTNIFIHILCIVQCILAKRRAIHNERKNLHACESMLQQTRDAINKHLRSLHQHMDDIQAVMSPVQLAKFYLWVENNEWCMQMLNSMFDNPQTTKPSITNPSTAPSHISVNNNEPQSPNDLVGNNNRTLQSSQYQSPIQSAIFNNNANVDQFINIPQPSSISPFH